MPGLESHERNTVTIQDNTGHEMLHSIMEGWWPTNGICAYEHRAWPTTIMHGLLEWPNNGTRGLLTGWMGHMAYLAHRMAYWCGAFMEEPTDRPCGLLVGDMV